MCREWKRRKAYYIEFFAPHVSHENRNLKKHVNCHIQAARICELPLFPITIFLMSHPLLVYETNKRPLYPVGHSSGDILHISRIRLLVTRNIYSLQKKWDLL